VSEIPRCLAIAGPTASGKSACALTLARRLLERGQAVEIISVDSALVYRGLDIGSAKPSAPERAVCPHHLIDIRDPAQPYSAAEFVRDARALLAQIHTRGALALLVGGTMLYYRALICGLDDMPGADASIRAALVQEAAERGWGALHARLAQVDPASAARLAPNDSQRIQRALEVWQITGQPLSHWQRQSSRAAAAPNRVIAPGGFFSLEPRARAWLHARIARRLDTMLADGLVAEVQRLRARADLHAQLPAMRCVGYRQTWQMLDGVFPEGELPARIAAATRQLAKRQITWLRAMLQRRAIACDAPDAQEQLAQAALAWLHGRGMD